MLRRAFRTIRNDLPFAIVTILTLGLAIGANTTIFSLANGLLLKSQPAIGDPQDLVDIGRTLGGSGFDTISYPNYLDYRKQTEVFSGMLAYTPEPIALSLRDTGAAERIYGSIVTSNYFGVLKVTPALGRFFSPEEDQLGSPAVVVMSDELWATRFERNPTVVGREIVLNGNTFTVIGIAPDRFHGASWIKSDAWVPIGMQPLVTPGQQLLQSRRPNWLTAVARLKPGVSRSQAQAAMSVLAAQLEKAYPEDNEAVGVAVAPHAGAPVGATDAITAFVALLMVVVGIILAIACANVAGICLARATNRRRDVAVRLALGANRKRIIAEFMTETFALVLISGLVGSLVATWLTELLLRFQRDIPVPAVFDLSADFRVMAFTVVATLLAGVLSGITPALQATRTDVVSSLKEESGSATYRHLRLRNTLVVAQVAMSLLLLIAGGLFLRALSHASSMNPGFDSANIYVTSFDLFLAGYTEQTGRTFGRELIERVSALPGVETASLAIDLPMNDSNFGFGGIRIPERQPPAPYRYFDADWNLVSPGYFRTLKMSVLRGRDFAATDVDGAPRVAIINEAMAQQLWPGEDPLGKRLYNGEIGTTEPMEVIGLVRNIKDKSLGQETEPFIYAPLSQMYIPRQSLVIRTSEAGNVLPAVRQLVQNLNPNLPIISVQSMDEVTAFGLLPQRLAFWVAGTMGIVGLLLTSLGIYGVTAYNVGRRTREIGIRVALGARPAAVLKLVLREGLALTTFGLVIGCAAAFALMRLIQGLLFGIGATDAVTFVLTSTIFVIVALVACYIPARRAVHVDPMVALRHE